MKKIRIQVEEKLIYNHEIEIEVEDDFEEDKLNRILNRVQMQSDNLSDVVIHLEEANIDVVEVSEMDLSSPNHWEIDIPDFDVE